MTTRQTPDAVREAVARETLAKQYDATLPSRAAHIRAGTSDHKAIDAMLSFAALDSRAGDAGEGLTANSMDLVEGVCTPIKALQPSYDPMNGYVTNNLPRWILDGWTGGNETYESASEQMQDWANDAARAVVAGIREDMESLEPTTPAPAVDAVPAGEVVRLHGVEGIGASFNRDTDCWHFYTMPDTKPLPVTVGPGFDRNLVDWVVGALRAALSHGEGRK